MPTNVGLEHLFPGRDVVGVACEQVERDLDVLQRQPSSETDALTPAKRFALNSSSMACR